MDDKSDILHTDVKFGDDPPDSNKYAAGILNMIFPQGNQGNGPREMKLCADDKSDILHTVIKFGDNPPDS